MYKSLLKWFDSSSLDYVLLWVIPPNIIVFSKCSASVIVHMLWFPILYRRSLCGVYLTVIQLF